MSTRELERITGRNRSTIGRFLNGEQAMNTNEIEVFALVFGMSPYQFVSNARTFEASGIHNVTQGPWATSDGELRLVATTDDNKAGAIDGDHIND